MSGQLVSSKLKLAAVIGAAVIVSDLVLFGLWKFAKKFLKSSPPKKWRKVGKVTDLTCFPIKSCGAIDLDEFSCEILGAAKSNLRDRTFMVVNSESGEFITGRKYPNLVLVSPDIQGDIMTLTAPDMEAITVDFAHLKKQPVTRAVVWDESVEVIDAGDEAARWFSRFIFHKEDGLRLVFYPLTVPTRDVRKKNKVFDTAIRKDTGALHDATSFMLINESSIADLNTKLQKPVPTSQFRGNFIITGPSAYAEDKWKWVKIGDEVVFENVKPCTRCVFTNIDPVTAVPDDNEEPLKTLKTYRKADKCGDSPVMGIHLGLRKQGTIRLNDSVFVGVE